MFSLIYDSHLQIIRCEYITWSNHRNHNSKKGTRMSNIEWNRLLLYSFSTKTIKSYELGLMNCTRRPLGIFKALTIFKVPILLPASDSESTG